MEDNSNKLTVLVFDRLWQKASTVLVPDNCTLATLKDALVAANCGYEKQRTLYYRHMNSDREYPLATEEQFQNIRRVISVLEVSFWGVFFATSTNAALSSCTFSYYADVIQKKAEELSFRHKALAVFLLATIIPIRFIWPFLLLLYLVRTFRPTVPPAEAPSSECVQPQPPFRYAAQLKQLSDWGFTDHVGNITLLEKHNGSIHDVVTEIVANFKK